MSPFSSQAPSLSLLTPSLLPGPGPLPRPPRAAPVQDQVGTDPIPMTPGFVPRLLPSALGPDRGPYPHTRPSIPTPPLILLSPPFLHPAQHPKLEPWAGEANLGQSPMWCLR